MNPSERDGPRIRILLDDLFGRPVSRELMARLRSAAGDNEHRLMVALCGVNPKRLIGKSDNEVAELLEGQIRNQRSPIKVRVRQRVSLDVLGSYAIYHIHVPPEVTVKTDWLRSSITVSRHPAFMSAAIDLDAVLESILRECCPGFVGSSREVSYYAGDNIPIKGRFTSDKMDPPAFICPEPVIKVFVGQRSAIPIAGDLHQKYRKDYATYGLPKALRNYVLSIAKEVICIIASKLVIR